MWLRKSLSYCNKKKMKSFDIFVFIKNARQIVLSIVWLSHNVGLSFPRSKKTEHIPLQISMCPSVCQSVGVSSTTWKTEKIKICTEGCSKLKARNT